jgi:hypothetical protein
MVQAGSMPMNYDISRTVLDACRTCSAVLHIAFLQERRKEANKKIKKKTWLPGLLCATKI